KAKDDFIGSDVRAAEQQLAEKSCRTWDPAEYRDYVKTRAAVWPVLSTFYAFYETAHTVSTHSCHKLKAQPVNKEWSKRKQHKMDQYTVHPARDYLLHRKLCLSAYLNQHQADTRLARNLRWKFGWDPVLAMGDWSAPMARYHEPIRGKGMRAMLKREGFEVYLIKEFRTSSLCPACLTGVLKLFC
ncbi:hypothetical protein LPJ61_005967, partial [Coemansia biformis]